MGFWSQLFLINWDRKCSELQIEWDNFSNEYDKENIRPEYKGVIRKSPITEREELYYSNNKRILSFIISGLKSIPYLFLGGFVLLLYLNLSGIIKKKEKSVFKIKMLMNLKKPGLILLNLGATWNSNQFSRKS